MKQLIPFISLISFTGSASALVGRVRREDAEVANNAPNLQDRHKGWKTGSWHHDDEHRATSTSTITVTVTVTITQPADVLPTDGVPVDNATTPVADGTTTTSTDDLAPITLIDISALLPTSLPTSEGSAAAPAPTENDLAPITLIDINTVSPTAAATSEDSAPTENDLAPITLIDLGTLQSVEARAAKQTAK